MDEAAAAIFLSHLPGLRQQQALALMNHYGSALAAIEDDAPHNPMWADIKRKREGWTQTEKWAVREAEYCRERNIQVVPFSSEHYPRLLKKENVSDAPAVLFYCGNAPLNRTHLLSVVGTRHITEYGKQMCERLLEDLARMVPDVLIVSGLAYGVDIHAHRAALANGLDTVAVLAHGHDRLYPPYHRDTANEMVSHGGLLTEYPSGTVPDKGNFVRRNRIVAGIAPATLVIESAAKGGSLITASLAASYGREVMAVPGRVTDEYSAGCHKLINENKATLVTSAADIVRIMGWENEADTPLLQPTLFPVYSPEEEKVMDALQKADDLSIDQLSTATSYPVSKITDLLFDLEDKDAVRKMRGNRYRLK